MSSERAKIIGENIRYLRKKQEMTIKQLSDALISVGEDVAPSTISAWERGDRRPYGDQLFSISEALNCSVDRLCMDLNRSTQSKLQERLESEVAHLPAHYQEILDYVLSRWPYDKFAVLESVGAYVALDEEHRVDIPGLAVYMYRLAVADGTIRGDAPKVDIDYVDRKQQGIFTPKKNRH